MTHQQRIIIYRNHLLRHSETFIRAQASHLSHFDYHYVGSRRVPGLTIPEEKVTTVYGPCLSSKINEFVYKTTGIAPALYRKIRALSPQLIHAHFGPDGVRSIPLAKALDVPLVVTFHGYSATINPAYACRSSYNQLMYLMRKSKLQREATHFIAVSDYIKGLLIEQGFSQDKISTHYIGLDTTVFTPDISTKREAIVLFVGRLVEMKGCEYLIRSMSKVQETLPEVGLVVIGDGPLRKSLEVIASKKIKNIRFLGFQPPSVVKTWLNRAKAFCVPSIKAKSGHTDAFGIVFAEAQAMGLPVVTFDSGGISEAVEQGRTGYLVPEKDEAALAECLIQVLEDPILWEKLSQAAMSRIRKKFDIQQQTQKLEELYSKLITS